MNGYFALRAAPLGPVGPAVAGASFFGFHPDRVAHALPDAWTYTSPDDALRARLAGADAARRQLWGEAILETDEVAEA
ncbi:MAG: helix-turn-helix domain-containing protein, partial [Steroidobacteraceae bacterium]